MRGPNGRCHASDCRIPRAEIFHTLFTKDKENVCGAKALANADTVKLLLV